MATDSAILTAAREVAAFKSAVIEADAAKAQAENTLRIVNERANDARKHLAEAERRLLDLSRQKPAEPAPKPVEVERIPPSLAIGGVRTHKHKDQPRTVAGG